MMALPPPASAVRVRDEQQLSRVAPPQLPSFHSNLRMVLFVPYRRAIVGQLAANGSSPSQFCPVVKAEHFSQSFIPCYLPHAKFYKVEAILRPWRVPHVSSGSFKMGIRGVTVFDVRGFGAQGRYVERQAGSELSEDNFVTKTNMEIVACKDQVEAVAEKMIEEARTGEIRDRNFELRHFCFNKYYLETRNKIDLCPKQISIMKSTAFANLIDMPLLHVDTRLLEDIIEMYRGDSTFEIAQGVNVVMKVEDVGRILGIPSKGMEIVRVGLGPSSKLTHVSRCLFGEEFFFNRKKKKKVGDQDIEFNMRELKLNKNTLGKYWRELATKEKNEDMVNMCRVWMLYLMSTFLIPSTAYYVPIYMLHYLQDVQSTTSMNWAKLVHKILFKDMETLQIEIKKKRKGQDYQQRIHATGCTMCLIVWIMELTQIATPRFPHIRPRIKKWAAPIKKKMELSDVDGSKVLKEIEYDKDDEWLEMKDQEQPYLTSTKLESEKAIEVMLKTLELVEELVRHKQKFNTTFLEKFCNLIKENTLLKKRHTELEDENKYLKEYFNRDLNEVIQEISLEQPNVRYLMNKKHAE